MTNIKARVRGELDALVIKRRALQEFVKKCPVTVSSTHYALLCVQLGIMFSYELVLEQRLDLWHHS